MLRSVFSTVLKPFISAVTEYLPGRTAAKTKLPLAPVF